MAISVANFGPLTEPVLRKAFVDGWTEVEDPILDLYTRQKTVKEVEHEIGIGEMGTTPEFTGTLLETEYFKQHQKDYRLKEWGQKLEIQRRAMSTDLYKVHAQKASMLGINLKRRYMEEAARPFNEAISGLSEVGRGADPEVRARGDHDHQRVREHVAALLGADETRALQLRHALAVRGEEDVGGSPGADLPGEVAGAGKAEADAVTGGALEGAAQLGEHVGEAGGGEDEQLFPRRPGNEPGGESKREREGPSHGSLRFLSATARMSLSSA